MASQQKTLSILKIELLSPQAHMNYEFFQALIASSMFEKLPEVTQELLNSIMSIPVEAMDIEVVTVEGVVPKFVTESTLR